MPKNPSTLSLCFSLFLIPLISANLSLAASVETVGDLKVNGVIESTSGGFKFPDGSTLNTAGLNGILFNVGFVVDNSGSNTGNFNSGAIKFGSSASGEGIASQRTAGGNQYGLDFYSDFTKRMSISQGGKVGIGTDAPSEALHVVGNVRASGNLTMGASALTASGGKDALTILRGFVAYSGWCMAGCSGFTVSRTATGTYTITPDSGVFASGDFPSYIVTAGYYQHVASAPLGGGGNATVYITRLSDNALVDAPFSIVIIGGQH
jgi:hypothetical protein